MGPFSRIYFIVYFLGFGVYFLLSAVRPDIFARGYLLNKLRHEKRAEERKILRVAIAIGGIGLLLMSITAIANATISDFPFYIFYGISIVLIAISLVITYYR